MMRVRCNRRSFLGAACAAVAVSLQTSSHRLLGGDAPNVTNPRATDGDEVHEPDWAQRLTITVGPDKADLVGRDDKVIQAAVDYVARLGGGTVQLLPGTFTLRNAVFLPSRLRLRGSGADTVLTKIASETIPLQDDSDWYDQEITLSAPGNFRVGDGVVLRAINPDNGGPTVIKRTLVARSGNRFKLNDGLRENLWVSGKPTCASLFPLLTSEHTADVVIEDLTLDGNRAEREPGRQLRRLHLPARLQPVHGSPCRSAELQRGRHQFPGLPRRRGGGVLQPRPRGARSASRLRLPAPADGRQSFGAQRNRAVLVLGCEIRFGRAEPD